MMMTWERIFRPPAWTVVNIIWAVAMRTQVVRTFRIRNIISASIPFADRAYRRVIKDSCANILTVTEMNRKMSR